jgi:hypothetical protein
MKSKYRIVKEIHYGNIRYIPYRRNKLGWWEGFYEIRIPKINFLTPRKDRVEFSTQQKAEEFIERKITEKAKEIKKRTVVKTYLTN